MGPLGPDVRVSGPPNRSFLTGYPGISATMPRIEGKVEIHPERGTLEMELSFVRICLQRHESIHLLGDKLLRKHVGPPRKVLTDVIGRELTLWKCRDGRESETLCKMEHYFMIPIPIGRGGEEVARRVPPASIQLPKIAETKYELVVTVHQGHSEIRKYTFPVPIQRYDTLSTFGMYNKQETRQGHTDHLVSMNMSVPKWSYGPGDPVAVYLNISPNPDYMNKAKKVMVQKIELSIEEVITFNHEGDEPTTRERIIQRKVQSVRERIPEAGYLTNIGCIFPCKDLRDANGIIRPREAWFPKQECESFTATASLYKIEFFLNVKASLSSAKDIQIKMPIVVCPMNAKACKDEMEAIEQAAKEAGTVDIDNPMMPAPVILRPGNKDSLRSLGWTFVGGQMKLLID